MSHVIGKALFILLLTAQTVFAQVAAKDQIYVIDDFSAGLKTKQSSLTIPKGSATVLENFRLDTENGSLSKRSQILVYGTADTTEAILGMYRLYLKDGTKAVVVSHGDEIEAGSDTTGAFTNILNLTTGDYRWQFLTWHDTLIGTDGYNQPIKWDGSSASATYLGSCLAKDAGSGSGPDGTYRYKVAFYTTTYTVILDVASNPATVTDNDISLSMIPIGPDTFLGEDVLGRKVYRTENGGTSYKLLSNGTIADNTTTTLTDSDADGALGAAYPTVDNSTVFSGQPPKGKFCLIHSNRLWIANNPDYPSRAYYSDDANMDFFESDAYFNIRPDDGDSITFMKQVLGVLTISKNNTIQKLYTEGDDPDADWAISDPFSFIGCKAPYSAVNTPEGVVYLAFDGIYKFNGQYSVLISDAITPTIRDILESNFVNCWAEYHKNNYYLAYPSKATGISTNNRVLILNLINKSFTIDLMNVNCFCTFNSGTDWDVLYSGASDAGKIYSHTGAAYEVRHYRHIDFTGTWDDMRYIPTGTPGGDANNPVIELAWTELINDVGDDINYYATASSAIIDRPDTNGTYTSQVLDIGASAFDKIYWNEDLKGYGDVEFAVRSSNTAASCPTATASAYVSDPTGSDLSSNTAYRYVQYIASMSTSDITYTPTLYKDVNYVVKLTYFKEAAAAETSIPVRWTSGWIQLMPGYKITLKKFEIYYTSESSGTLTATFTDWKGGTDTFSINLAEYPSYYTRRFIGGKFLTDTFKIDLSERSLNALSIRKVICTYDIEPID